MAESDAERIARENRATEELGAKWQSRSDAFLVGYVSENRPGQFHTPAIVEIQRRLLIAIREFNEQSSRQAATMIRLTRWIIALTIILGMIALVQLWAMLKGVA